jgi:hypothetical protein
MNKGKPPSTQCQARPSLFRVGGLFVDRAQALKFAMFENGNRPQAVMMVPGILELDINGRADTPPHVAANTQAPRRRVA